MSRENTDKQALNEHKTFSDRKNMRILFLCTFVIAAIMGCLLNVACVLDETGVVANAAYLAGYNWHDWVKATGGYFYKYGLALLYVPILKIFNNPYIIYKLMMVVNAILIAIVPVCAYGVLRKHLQVQDKKLAAVTSFVVGIVPASVLYSLSAKADVALISFTWVLLVVILEGMAAEEGKKQILFSVLTAIVSVYLYMSHTRGIVFVIAAFMTMFVIRFILKKKSIRFIPYLVALLIFMVIDKKLTAFFKVNIWGDGKMKNTMDGFSLEKFRKMFTFTGARTLIENATGWLFDSVIGTYGLVIVGAFFALLIIVLYFKKREISDSEFVLSLYGLLVFVGTMALGLLFFFRANFKLVAGYTSSRVDRMFYSRYMSPSYAILILIAIYYLFIKTDLFGWKSKIFAVLFSGAVIVYVGTWVYDMTQECGFSWRNVLDCGLFYKPEYFGKDAGSYVGNGIANALMLGAVLGFVVLVILIVISQKQVKQKSAMVVIIGICFMVALVGNYVKLRFSADMRTMNVCGSVFTQMEEIVDQYETVTSEYNDLYYDSKNSSGYKFYQMGFPNFNVLVKSKAKLEEIENAFIVTRTNVLDERWAGDDCYLLADYDYENNVNGIIVKGEKLKASLEEHGISVVPLPEDYGLEDKNSVPESYWDAVKKSFSCQIESIMN